MPVETFGDRVKKVREAAKLSQAQIERHLGKAERSGYLSNIESGARGKRPSADLVEALVELAGAARRYLLDGAGPMFSAEGPALQVIEGGRGKRTVDRETDEYSSFRVWLALADGGKALVPEVVNALREEARDRRADGDPGEAHWTKRYAELRTRKREIDDLRTLSDDELS